MKISNVKVTILVHFLYNYCLLLFVVSRRSDSSSKLPQGFFDDPKVDAKVLCSLPFSVIPC